MSSRVLKKLHGENELEIREQDVSDVEIENDIGSGGGGSGGGARKKHFEMNRYDLVSTLRYALINDDFEAGPASVVYLRSRAMQCHDEAHETIDFYHNWRSFVL